MLLNPEANFTYEIRNQSIEFPSNYVVFNEDVELMRKALEFVKDE